MVVKTTINNQNLNLLVTWTFYPIDYLYVNLHYSIEYLY